MPIMGMKDIRTYCQATLLAASSTVPKRPISFVLNRAQTVTSLSQCSPWGAPTL